MQRDHAERGVEQRLRGAGVRFTRGRRRVFRALMTADGPRSAAELQIELDGDVPLSSLYRTLSVLADAGVVARHHGAGGIIRYEPADWVSGHHHHLVCLECGAVDDIHLSPGDERALERLATRVAGAGDFTAADHALEIEGRCARCR